MRFNIINHLIHWFKVAPLDGSCKGFKILNFKSIHFKKGPLPAHKDSLRTLSPSRIFEKSEKEPKGKGIEIDKFCLKNCCHYGSRLVIINSYFAECEYHEIKYLG